MDILERQLPAISIRQPWAELIISGKKSIEIRSWSTEYRGHFWVHTGRNSDGKLERFYGFTELFHGGYLGVTKLEYIIPFNSVLWKQWQPLHFDQGDYQPGFYAWMLSNPIRLNQPIPGVGSTGLFKISIEIERLLIQVLPKT
jgi:hypothetical protein